MDFIEESFQVSELNRRRCNAIRCVASFCAEYDLDPWEMLLNYYTQFTDLLKEGER
jgi:hypothetical protein